MRSLLQVALLALCACECGASREVKRPDAGKLDNAVSTTPCPPGMTHCPGHGPKTFEER